MLLIQYIFIYPDTCIHPLSNYSV